MDHAKRSLRGNAVRDALRPLLLAGCRGERTTRSVADGIPTRERYALPTSMNDQPDLTRSHGPRGNALPDAPASYRRRVRVGSSSHRGASENGRFKDTMEMRTNSGPQAYGLCVAHDTGTRPQTLGSAAKSRESALAVRRRSVAGRHSHGDCGNEKTRVPPASDLWVMHSSSPWERRPGGSASSSAGGMSRRADDAERRRRHSHAGAWERGFFASHWEARAPTAITSWR